MHWLFKFPLRAIDAFHFDVSVVQLSMRYL